MTVYPTQPNRPSQPAGSWNRPAQHEPGRLGRTGYGPAVAAIVLLTLAVVCVAAFLAVRLFAPASWLGAVIPGAEASPTPAAPGEGATATPAPGRASVSITPTQGGMDTLITVDGQRWWPGEPVFVFLRLPSEGSGRAYAYAAAVADDAGRFQTAFSFPREARWIGQQRADVVVRGSRSGIEASAAFSLIAPTPTPAPPQPTLTSTPPPTATPVPSATPTPPVVITDWRGEYYANPWLSGSPALVRNDVRLSFNWGQGEPAPGLPADQFSVLWARRIALDRGLYRFTVGADDGVRLWVDGVLRVNEWHDSPFTVYSFDLALDQGEHSLILEYYESLGEARIDLVWAQIAQPTPTPSPSPTATPTATPTPSPTAPPLPVTPWGAEYFDNTHLEGRPVLVREDEAVDFDWGDGSPGGDVPADWFSARWTQDVWVPGGTYRISVEVDDGVRVWVDETVILDSWQPSGGATYTVEVWIEEGVHRFQVEFFEDVQDARIRYTRQMLVLPASAAP